MTTIAVLSLTLVGCGGGAPTAETAAPLVPGQDHSTTYPTPRISSPCRSDAGLAGTSFLAIQAAYEEFRKHAQPDLRRYVMNINCEGEIIIVSFLVSDRPPGVLGGPGFEVHVKTDDLTIQDAHGIR